MKYLPEEKGKWRIYGENPRDSIQDSRCSPLLMTVVGTYKNVEAYAKTLTNFYIWGLGGYIEKVLDEDLVDIDLIFNPKINALRKQLLKLNAKKIATDKAIVSIENEIKRLSSSVKV
jgi:hypothetical protein